MITRENFHSVLSLITDKDKKRLLNTDKEFVVIYLHTFNVGSVVTITLTNNFNRYKNVSNNGDCILYCEEVKNLIS